MRWLETEKDMGPSVLLWGALGWGIGIAVFFMSDWVTAIFAGLIAVAITSLLVGLVASWHIPAEARHAADRAVDAFNKLYPNCKLASVALRSIEENRYVYSIRYDGPDNVRSKPQARRYFAVSRDSEPLVDELDKSDWWPRGLK
jgi:hypothetical protein